MTIPAMQKLAQDYRRNAQQCQDIANFLKSPLATMFWQSQAATSFRDNINEYTRVLNNFQEAFTGLSTDVDARWRALEASGNR
ncbi:MAG: WXG100 family type VII secretion target [Chloroflexi bacterium]|nr:WXG100 family type VII secretion target [Chloroflexota bacterium]